MSKELVSDKQGISIIILFIIGSASVFELAIEAKQDLWIAIILGLLASIPFAVLCARLHSLFPGKDLFDIFDICFGKFIGTLITVFFILLNVFWSAQIMDNYGFFINTVTLPETPMIVPIVGMTLLCAIILKCGLESLGRWSEFFISVPIIILIFGMLALIPEMNMDNIKPILNNGFYPIFKGMFSVMGFPFCQLFSSITIVLSVFKNENSPYKIYTIGLLLGGLILFLHSLINLLVLGINLSEELYYPTYIVFQKVDIGHFIQRLEIILATTFLLGGFVKISICLMCSCKGIVKIFNIDDYKFISLPISLLSINLSYFLYENVQEFTYFTKNIWPYALFPIQIIFPIILLAFAEVKKKD